MRFELKLIICAFGISINLGAQEINGKWINIRQPDELMYPLVQIIEFANDSISNFDFKNQYDKYPVRISDNRIIISDSISGFFTFKKGNRIEFIAQPKERKVMDTDTRLNYIRLCRTIDKDSLAEKIESYRYEFPYKNFRNTVVFNKKLDESEFIYLQKHTIIGDFITLKEWEGIYFLTFYFNDILTYAFPIKEIQPNDITIYGVPEKEFGIKLYVAKSKI
ncbi:MAG: hypothetical protein AAF717_13265 [Bacteroidota bacterium]